MWYDEFLDLSLMYPTYPIGTKGFHPLIFTLEEIL
jgi:hypothetical protein